MSPSGHRLNSSPSFLSGAMAPLGRSLRSRFVVFRRTPPPQNSAAATISSYLPWSSDLLPYRTLLGVTFSTAVAQGCDTSSSSLQEEKSCESKLNSGIGSLHSLFYRPSSPGVLHFDTKAGGAEPRVQSIRRSFPYRRGMTRTKRPEDRESSVEVHSGGEALIEIDLLIRRLNEDGYLKSSNFSRGLDTRGVFTNGFLRGLLMKAAERFGDHHQEIAKWLSGSSLKKVALSGCPCTERKTVFAAKRLRSFFFIQEDVICRGCPMKKSCKFVNQNVNREQKLVLADVMRVLTAYACGNCAPHAMKSQDLRHSVASSLKEVISLSS